MRRQYRIVNKGAGPLSITKNNLFLVQGTTEVFSNVIEAQRLITSRELQTLFSVGSIELQPAVSGRFYEVLSATIKYEPVGNPYNTGQPLFITNFTTEINDSQFRAVGGTFLAEPTERWQKLHNQPQPNEGTLPIVGLPLNISCTNNLGNGGGTVTVYYTYRLVTL